MVDLRSNGDLHLGKYYAGRIFLRNGEVEVFQANSHQFTAEELRAIADKLDELNGTNTTN